MNPKSILGKYVIKQMMVYFLSVLLMVAGIIALFDIVEMLRKFSSNPSVTMLMIIQLTITKIPYTMEKIFPFVVMVSAMATFWKFSKTNEFVVIKASGVSVWKFLCPALFLAFLIGIVNVTTINPISAKMTEFYETIRYRIKTKNPTAILFSTKGLWLREAMDEETFVVLSAKSVRQEPEGLLLREVTLLELDRHSLLLKRIEAFAAMLKNDVFELKDVSVFIPGEPTSSLPQLTYKTSITTDRIKENFIEPDAISFWNLPETIAFYENSGFSALKHKMRFMNLLASPFLLMAMVFVAAIFALRPNNRRGGMLFLIVGGIMSGFIIFFLSQVIYAFGLNKELPIFFAVWIPIIIVYLICITVMLQLEEEK